MAETSVVLTGYVLFLSCVVLRQLLFGGVGWGGCGGKVCERSYASKQITHLSASMPLRSVSFFCVGWLFTEAVRATYLIRYESCICKAAA